MKWQWLLTAKGGNVAAKNENRKYKAAS